MLGMSRARLVAYLAYWGMAVSLTVIGIAFSAHWMIREPNGVYDSRLTQEAGFIGMPLLVIGLVMIASALLLEALGKVQRTSRDPEVTA